MKRQKINLNKLPIQTTIVTEEITHILIAQEIHPQFGETQIHPKIEANSIFCYNGSSF